MVGPLFCTGENCQTAVAERARLALSSWPSTPLQPLHGLSRNTPTRLGDPTKNRPRRHSSKTRSSHPRRAWGHPGRACHKWRRRLASFPVLRGHNTKNGHDQSMKIMRDGLHVYIVRCCCLHRFNKRCPVLPLLVRRTATITTLPSNGIIFSKLRVVETDFMGPIFQRC